MNITKLDTLHQSKRSINAKIDAIIIHDTGSHSFHSTLEWFINPLSKVSAHYLIDKDGGVYQFVEDSEKAWHAGVSSLHGRPNCNDYSIGIELVDADDNNPYPMEQMDALLELCSDLCVRHGIPLNRVVGHNMVAEPPGRKVDPGKDFPWNEFLVTLASMINKKEIEGDA